MNFTIKQGEVISLQIWMKKIKIPTNVTFKVPGDKWSMCKSLTISHSFVVAAMLLLVQVMWGNGRGPQVLRCKINHPFKSWKHNLRPHVLAQCKFTLTRTISNQISIFPCVRCNNQLSYNWITESWEMRLFRPQYYETENARCQVWYPCLKKKNIYYGHD